MSQLRGTSILDLARPIRVTPKGGKKKDAAKITDGLVRDKYPYEEGYHIATPEQMLSLVVPVQQLVGGADGKGELVGFQRPLDVRHARKIAHAIEHGTPMPTVEIALHRNAAWVDDGQHRIIAAIMARSELPTLARPLNADQMRALFASQARGKQVNPSTIVLSATDPWSEYVQDAVTSAEHPWSHLVTHNLASEKRLTPSQMRNAVVPYSLNIIDSAQSQRTLGAMTDRAGLDKYRADQLAALITPFGTKEENPMAYRAIVFRGLVRAATIIIRRHNDDNEAATVRRWKEWMPRFPFAQYQGVTSTTDYTPLLVAHWNKRLQPQHRVPVPS